MSHRHHHEDEEMKEAQKRAAMTHRQQEMGGKFNYPEGRHVFRVLKTPSDSERNSPAIYQEYQMHHGIGPNKRSCRCGDEPGERHGKRCWLGKKQRQQIKEGNTRRAALLEPKPTLAVNIAFRDDDSGEFMGPILWSSAIGKSAKSASYQLTGILGSPKAQKYLDHKHGYNFSLRRKGQLKNTVWGTLERDDDSSRVSSEILRRLKPFADVLPQYDEDYQKAAYYGRDDEEKTMGKKKH